MSLQNYWPSSEEINKCIKAEAENASDEVLLAVHQQFPLVYLTVGPDGKVMPDSSTDTTEEDLLKYFISDSPSGSHVVPITGASGVGKSHLIRILDARLRRLPNADKYLIIRIPKSASLRRVVELILEAEPLNSKKYEKVKKAFAKALADVSLTDAVINFQSQLEIELNQYASKLRGTQLSTQDKERLGHAEKLPILMSDAETVEHFRSRVLPRIIHRSVKGAEKENGEFKEIDSTTAQFKVDDLDLSSVSWGGANQQVAKYYQLALLAREGRGKLVAVEVLNDVVDQATSRVFKLNDSIGEMTLGEVILEIRRLLLDDDRELVILVEDFAALVGIQDTLAKVLIQEGETSKGKEFATIRSAIAVTDGYLAGRDTLATRAGREWVIKNRLDSEQETLKRTKLLVASYINAARYGESELKKYYHQAQSLTGRGSDLWNPPIYSVANEEDEKILQAFGYEGSVPLFPFTEESIECLAHLALTSGNDLVFNPRFVIKNIIRELLVSGKEAFVNGQFPAPGMRQKNPSAGVAQWLASLPVSDAERKRYERLVTIWGNDPKTPSDIGRIPGEIFDAFKLSRPELGKVEIEPPKKTETKLPPQSKVGELSRQDQVVSGYKTALEDWVQKGTLLEQAFANKIRKALESLINQRIDWNGERTQKQEIKSDRFSIPNARGEQGLANDAMKIAPDNRDPDGSLRLELLALLRYVEVYNSTTEYDEVDDDIARIANLIDRLIPEALKLLRITIQKQNEASLLALAANSRLLGIAERGRTPSAISSFLFGDTSKYEELDVDGTPQPFLEWKNLQRSAISIRPELSQIVLNTSGCFQGVGKTVQGVDIIRLVEDYPNDDAVLDISNLSGLSPELRQSVQNLSESKVTARLNQVLQEARKIQ
ncbi:MAG TPA: protein DpdH, partial [Desulfosporosinus sp.]|nr:protein DpdH [Desulfosporosinus sp.]